MAELNNTLITLIVPAEMAGLRGRQQRGRTDFSSLAWQERPRKYGFPRLFPVRRVQYYPVS